MLTTTKIFVAEEGAGKSWMVTAIAYLLDLFGEKAPAMSVDFKGWRS
jgi:predicted ATP-binding protein involved in virulence